MISPKIAVATSWLIWWATTFGVHRPLFVSSFATRPTFSKRGHALSQWQPTRSIHPPFVNSEVTSSSSSIINIQALHQALHASRLDDDKDVDNDNVDNVSVVDDPDKTFMIRKKSTDPTPVVLSWLQEHNVKPGVLVASMALSLLLVSSSPMSSWAAMSGGRMGGGSFSSPSRGGGGSSYSRSYSAPSYNRGFSQGYGSGYMSRPSVSITPFYNPFFSPFPQPYFFGGPGVIAYSRGPSLLDLFLLGGLVFAITSFVRNSQSFVDEETETSGNLFSGWGGAATTSALGSGTSVLQLSVALDVPNRDDSQSMLSVLNRLAATARTDSRVGLSNLTSQVALELLRRKSSIVSASTKYQHFNDRNKAQREFQSIAIKERGKFETETVSKYAGVDYSNSADSSKRLASGSGGSSTSSSPQATMAVVTLVLAIDGDSTKLSPIRTMADVEDALRKIASDAKVDDCLQSCEILWTPEERSETLTLRDVVADYPELRTV